MTSLDIFNHLPAAEAAALIRPCLDIDRWVGTLVDGRPYTDREALFAAGRTAAHPPTGAELEAALAHHPRIGERASGSSTEAGLSRGEQAGLDLDHDVEQRLAEGNREYERRFGRVFLIRAAGRSSTDILDALTTQLDHDVETEDRVIADQLREIALLRLTAVIDREAAATEPEEGTS